MSGERYYARTVNGLGGFLFPDSECIILAACQSGVTDSNGYNLVDTFFVKGAKCVLGFTVNINCGDTNAWIKAFAIAVNERLSLGASIDIVDFRLCIDDATSDVSDTSTVQNQYLRYSEE